MPRKKSITYKEKMKELENEIKKLKEENAELMDKYLRLGAEFENYKKREERRISDIKNTTKQQFLLTLIELKDDLDNVLEHADTATKNDVKQGLSLIQRNMKNILARENIEEYCEKNHTFDPELHHAIATDSGCDEGKIAKVFKKGYKQGNNVIRPALVVVGAKKKEENKKDDSQDKNQKEG
ncbi:nucleotide exchange factor GrpE [bacterium]|nr:nucleotide exchange factor GrpE [bacterium]